MFDSRPSTEVGTAFGNETKVSALLTTSGAETGGWR